MIASAWLGRTVSARRARWADTLGQSGWVLPFTVVAEMRFGARVAATALAGNLPLATDDGIFDHVEGLNRLQP